MKRCLPSPAGRHIALYPGAFKPPHKAHFAAVAGLASRADIDEVVVIVSNRCRHIPGTSKAFGAEVALRVLEIFLRDVAKVRIEIATHNAVTHALGYLDNAQAGDVLSFCVGETDLNRGDDRYCSLLEHQNPPAVSVQILPLPTAALKVRATALRAALADGDAGRHPFDAAMPDHLNDAQRDAVWSICRSSAREITHIVQEKLRLLLEPELGRLSELACVGPGKVDPVFRARTGDGRCVFIKYAGETAEAGTIGHPLRPKPRRRLSAERRAIKCLRANLQAPVEVADIVLFDKRSSLLVLSEVCAGGHSLEHEWSVGVFNPQLASAVGRLLGGCHTMTGLPALWGEADNDLRHWAAMLELRTVATTAPLCNWPLQAQLQQLCAASDSARTEGFFVLDCSPKNILVGSAGIGLIDLELCGSIGDPAYDLGTLLGHCVLWGLCTAGPACQATIAAALEAYRLQAPLDSPGAHSRIVAFAGAAILGAVVRRPRSELQPFEARLLATGAALLSAGVDGAEDAEKLLSSAAGGRFT